ncbi:MAG: hypothetical protein ACTSU2_01810 [Promethearchaeota archaeon]
MERTVCPYCHKKLDKPYWRHIQLEHPNEYEHSKGTWKELYQDYTKIGMSSEIAIKAICELFNKSEEEVKEFLSNEGILKA